MSNTHTRKSSINRVKKVTKTASSFFKPNYSIMNRVNTNKLNFLRERAYVSGNLKSNFDFANRNELFAVPEKYHIRVKSQIDKELDINSIAQDKKLNEKLNNHIKDYTPISKRSILVNKCFNSSGIKGCLAQNDNVPIVNYGHSKNNKSSDIFNTKINSIPVSSLNKNKVEKKSNLSLNSNGMKMSLLG